MGECFRLAGWKAPPDAIFEQAGMWKEGGTMSFQDIQRVTRIGRGYPGKKAAGSGTSQANHRRGPKGRDCCGGSRPAPGQGSGEPVDGGGGAAGPGGDGPDAGGQ